jgi:hypothetical protein
MVLRPIQLPENRVKNCNALNFDWEVPGKVVTLKAETERQRDRETDVGTQY